MAAIAPFERPWVPESSDNVLCPPSPPPSEPPEPDVEPVLDVLWEEAPDRVIDDCEPAADRLE